MSNFSSNITKLEKIIRELDNFVVITHQFPDGDAVGASLALSEYLKNIGKKVMCVTISEIPQILSYLKDSQEFLHDIKDLKYDAVILLDCGDLKRTGFLEQLLTMKNKLPIINIDHHIQNDIWKLAKINLADPTTSSTCQILYQIFKEWEVEISPDQATALLTGIYYDTGGFLHTNTSNQVLEITSELLRKGAKLKQVKKSVSQSRSTAMLKLWGIALDKMIVDKNLGMIISTITQEDLKKAEANEEELSGLVNMIDTAQEARATVLLYETADGKIKGSLRTENNDVDVAAIASLFGGGGHKKAAGFLINGKFEKVGSGWKVV